MTDEEYVRSVWTRVDAFDVSDRVFGHFCVSLRHGSFNDRTAVNAWSAAAEYTRTHLERLRQLREDIRFVCEADYSGADGEVTEQAAAAQKRTLDRLESALATLTQGMHPDVQP